MRDFDQAMATGEAIEQDGGLDQNLPPRIFIREPGWRVEAKIGSERTFCHLISPGQDYHHRLVDGEIYLKRGDEKLCLRCATRQGLLSFEPKRLRDKPNSKDIEVLFNALIEEIELGPERY